jgi:hypothetical protein
VLEIAPKQISILVAQSVGVEDFDGDFATEGIVESSKLRPERRTAAMLLG